MMTPPGSPSLELMENNRRIISMLRMGFSGPEVDDPAFDVPRMSAARTALNGIYDELRAGVPPTRQTIQRSLANLRELADSEGALVANDYRKKLRAAALISAGALMRSTESMRHATVGASAPSVSRGVAATAEQLRDMQRRFVQSMKDRGIHV